MTDHPRRVDASRTANRILRFALVGGVVGLVAGLLLAWLTASDFLDNPFWAMGIGIAVGAALSGPAKLEEPGQEE